MSTLLRDQLANEMDSKPKPKCGFHVSYKDPEIALFCNSKFYEGADPALIIEQFKKDFPQCQFLGMGIQQN